MPTPALLLLLAALMPLVAAIVLTLLGQRLGAPLAGWVATAFICLSFAWSIWAMVSWYDPQGGHYQGKEWQMGEQPILLTLPWLAVGPGVQQEHAGYLDVGIYVDSLTIAMFAMITLIAALVHVYSTGFMSSNRAYPGFFASLAFLCFSVMGLALSGTLLQLFMFWELIAIGTYVMVGGFGDRERARGAALKAYIIGRFADVGLLVGIAILTVRLRNLAFPQLWAALGDASLGSIVHLAKGQELSLGLMTFVGLSLVIGALGAAAQFPFYGWISDSTEATPPVSAVIQTIAQLAAAVYLLARIFPILTPQVRLVIAIVGAATLLLGGLFALVQRDALRLLAYSTMSQAGLMVLAIGLGSWAGGLFHLVTHDFFKALLLLSAGAVYWSVRGKPGFAQFGGLWRKMPWTGLAFAIAILAAQGPAWFSGYYSRSEILIDAGATATLATRFLNHSNAYWLFFIVPVAATYLGAFYLTRCWLLLFAGKPRDATVHQQARESPILWVPLLMLAGVSIFAGTMLGAPSLLRASTIESSAICRDLRAHDGVNHDSELTGFSQMWPAPQNVGMPHQTDSADALADSPAADFTPAAWARDHGEALAGAWQVKWGWAIGMALAIAFFQIEGLVIPRLWKVAPIRWSVIWLQSGMLLPEFYEIVAVRITIVCSTVLAAFDRYVLVGMVNLIARGVRRSSWIRSHTTF